MGLITIFFVASKKELEGQFEDWLPVAPDKYVQVVNPFTNETQLDWGPEPEALRKWNEVYQERLNTYLMQVSEERKRRSWFTRIFLTNKVPPMPVNGIDFTVFPHVQYKRVDVIKLSILDTILEGISFETALEHIAIPVLIDPLSNEQCLHCFSLPFAQALSKCNVDKVAEKWIETEELKRDGFTIEDGIEVIKELRKLAEQANEYQKNLYHFWSL